MDTHETLELLRWIEEAEVEIAEHRRQREVSRQAADLEIVIAAQLHAARQRLICANHGRNA